MTQTEKDLLLKDMCGRLPYGVKVQTGPRRDEHDDNKIIYDHYEVLDFIMMAIMFRDNIEEYKPYLFPLFSMTEEQKKELRDMGWSFDGASICNILKYFGTYRAYVDHSCCFDLIDWCSKNHFDYRGLISMGLAIDATGLNIY